MTTVPTPPIDDSSFVKSPGFDAPVTSQKADHLNRWPLARQVYNIAVGGPKEWSSRIGVYGQWGTGKTSVLQFVASMARRDGHIVVLFDPWAHSSKEDLWRSFVLNLCETAEDKLGGITTAGVIRKRSYFGKARDFLSKVANAVPGEQGAAATGMFELLRGAFAFSAQEIDDLLRELKGHRIIVLIDDLDRTAAELVPEILYALKEVMDVPGFSFICGFDPEVVGKVLSSKHPGFGNGLKFLEKIIDYPVWIPPPALEGLRRMAEEDSRIYCPFVDSLALCDALELLPSNPRAIRQFVRICALLKNQTGRYGSEELNWPIILTSNAIKVRFPHLDASLVHSSEFYREIRILRGYEQSPQEEKNMKEAIKVHAAKCLGLENEDESDSSGRDWLESALVRICQHMDSLFGSGLTVILSNVNLADRPDALTRKEFGMLTSMWKNRNSSPEIAGWIVDHVERHGVLKVKVAESLILYLLEKFKTELSLADRSFDVQSGRRHRSAAKRTLSFLEELIIRPSKFSAEFENRVWLPVAFLVEEMVQLVEAGGPLHQELWPNIDMLLTRLVKDWNGGFDVLLEAVRGIGPDRRRSMDRPASIAAAKRLNEIVDDKLCIEIVDGIGQNGFIERVAYRRSRTSEMLKMIRDSNSRMWKVHRTALIAAFSKPRASSVVQINAYQFLDWIQYLLKNKGSGDAKSAKAILADSDLIQAIWGAATLKPFLGLHAHRIRVIPVEAKAAGSDLDLPEWWEPAIEEYLRILERAASVGDAGDKVS